MLGVLILTLLLDGFSIGRAGLLLFVLAVWALQLWWSQAWMQRFRFGPAEWLCRGCDLPEGSAPAPGVSPQSRIYQTVKTAVHDQGRGR